MPDCHRLHAARGSRDRQFLGVVSASDRKRPLRLDLGTNGVRVVDEVDHPDAFTHPCNSASAFATASGCVDCGVRFFPIDAAAVTA